MRQNEWIIRRRNGCLLLGDSPGTSDMDKWSRMKALIRSAVEDAGEHCDSGDCQLEGEGGGAQQLEGSQAGTAPEQARYCLAPEGVLLPSLCVEGHHQHGQGREGQPGGEEVPAHDQVVAGEEAAESVEEVPASEQVHPHQQQEKGQVHPQVRVVQALLCHLHPPVDPARARQHQAVAPHPNWPAEIETARSEALADVATAVVDVEGGQARREDHSRRQPPPLLLPRPPPRQKQGPSRPQHPPAAQVLSVCEVEGGKKGSKHLPCCAAEDDGLDEVAGEEPPAGECPLGAEAAPLPQVVHYSGGDQLGQW